MLYFDILYSNYLDKKGKCITIGGVQTYITNLIRVIAELGYESRIFQISDIAFERRVDDKSIVIGVPARGNFKKQCKQLMNVALKTRNISDEYITIYGSDVMIQGARIANSIAIQHGIYWDMLGEKHYNLVCSFILKCLKAFPILYRISKVDVVVCVDNNFICWHRTQLNERNVKLIPILNFTDICERFEKQKTDKVKIVFARRFFTYRGTRLFANVALLLLKKYSNIEFTFAGSGPDEEYLKSLFKTEKRVIFSSYNSDESLNFHKLFDIAVVPTTGSEGTSLSLLEAMSSQCAVVCTNVGGMTNIVIDGYNGIMVIPEEEQLYKALCKLIENENLRERLIENGYNTVKYGFSLEVWKNKWKDVLKNALEMWSKT